MIEIINAVVKGRARYRIRELYRSELCKQKLELELRQIEDITDASASTLTGSLLVRYNSHNTPDSIASLIESILSEMPEEPQPKSPLFSARSKEDGGEIQQLTRSLQESVRPDSGDLLSPGSSKSGELWHTRGAGEVLSVLNSSAEKGLSNAHARTQVKKYGKNILPEATPRSRLTIFLEQFQSLPVALLGVAAGISVITGGLADAVFIMGVVAINAAIGYSTESEAEKTIESLKSIVRPSAPVIREGRHLEIDIRNIVPGDILVLRPGIYVAADSRLIEADYLSVDESALTGESLPAIKTTRPIPNRHIPIGDRKNMVYMGTLVTGGQGLAVVVATGRRSELGQLQLLVGEAQAPETPMEKQLRRMGNQLVFISGGVCGAVFLIGLIRGAGFFQMFKTSIALAVAAVPEGLPAVATTTLALGIRKMQKRQVLIRHLEAVETLGSVQTICFDKTGTVTQNRMSVQQISMGGARIGFHDGRFYPMDDSPPDFFISEGFLKLMQVCVLCSESELIKEGAEYSLHGSPTENALIRAAILAGVDVVRLRKQYRLTRINHRSEDRHFMASLHERSDGERLFTLKGSPMEVLSLCEWYLKDGERLSLTENIRLLIETENEQMAGAALRVLGFCHSLAKDDSIFDEPRDLTWLGLIGMADPVRKGVKELIPLFHQAGIDTIMITGDQASTAYSIGKELNLSRNDPLEILDSTQLANIEPEALKALSERVHVFARVSPANKLQIVQALQNAGRVVAMTGDGINDGPALKAADIGVALGASGTDVAREVADVVLEKDDLETMILAVGQGRTIYSNIRKSLHFLLATNFSEIIVMFTAATAGIGYPLTTMQLLWINLISDIFPGMALAIEPPEPDVLQRPPRDPKEPIIRKSDFKRISAEAGILSAGSLTAYIYGLARYGYGTQAGTMAFQSLTLAQLLHAITCRSEQHGIFSKDDFPPNKYLNLAVGGSIMIQLMTMLIPGLRNFLGLSPLGLLDMLVTGGSAMVPLLINEAKKELPKDNAL